MTSLPRGFRSPWLLLSLALLGGLLATLLPAAPSHADDANTLTVVGTSDVYDSNLVQDVIKPGFEKAYPQYTLNYVSKGTGAAIAYAEAGTASALIVHAAALENQFVASGYSYERYGRAIFWGDYVLLGPASDPAHVMTDAPHDIVTAFEKVAAAGGLGQANFVSRGGTPGTTVQEHAIWARTTGVTTCQMSDLNGGGTSPSTTTGDCPSSISYPSWYHATGLTQGPNLVNADACNYPSDNGNCYVFTDRGTFQYLESTGAITNLQIVTRDNSNSARGGRTMLVNSFHAYAVNPAAFSGVPDVAINLPAAQALLSWLTSVPGQRAIGAFLSAGGDPPFLPDAAPAVTSAVPPAMVTKGSTLTLKGTIKNVVPGTPALSGKRVQLLGVPPAHPRAQGVILRRTTTNVKGAWTFTARPSRSWTYRVSVLPITMIENSTLSPVFGDLLAPVKQKIGTVLVK